MAFLAKFLFFIAAFLAVDAQRHGGRGGGGGGGVGGVGGGFGSGSGFEKFFGELQLELVKNIEFSKDVDFVTVSRVSSSFSDVFSDFVDLVDLVFEDVIDSDDASVVKGVFHDVSNVFRFVSEKFSAIGGGSGVGGSGVGGSGGGRSGKGRSGGGRHFSRGTY